MSAETVPAGASDPQLSIGQARALVTSVEKRLSPAIAFTHTVPGQRNPNSLPDLIGITNDLLVEWTGYDGRIPARLFISTYTNIIHTIDDLANLQDYMAEIVNGAPALPGQMWETVQGGGRQLVVDVQKIREMAELGMADADIAYYLRCSRSTIHRRRKLEGIEKRGWSLLSPEDIALVSPSQ